MHNEATVDLGTICLFLSLLVCSFSCLLLFSFFGPVSFLPCATILTQSPHLDQPTRRTWRSLALRAASIFCERTEDCVLMLLSKCSPERIYGRTSQHMKRTFTTKRSRFLCSEPGEMGPGCNPRLTHSSLRQLCHWMFKLFALLSNTGYGMHIYINVQRCMDVNKF